MSKLLSGIALTFALLSVAPLQQAAAQRAPASSAPWEAQHERHGGKDSAEPSRYSLAGPAACERQYADLFPCHRVDLLGHVDVSQGGTRLGNDLWGWVDRRTRREYALMGQAAGVTFVDVTDPTEPVVVGTLPTETEPSAWRDVKVYRDWALVVADSVGPHGVQFFNLRRLRTATPGETFAPDHVYDAVGSAHNIAINEETAFAYVVGSNTCSGGLHMIDIARPAAPLFAGCFADDGYTHDVQCVVYRGPDGDYQGHELCFAANEDTLTLVDVSDKSSPRMVARASYPGAAYAHQGWLSEDHAWFFLGDEGDEALDGMRTRTLIWNLSDLDQPALAGEHLSRKRAIDHNLFVLGDLVFEANYTRGLQVLRFEDLAAGTLREVARFDTYPESNEPTFNGAWSVYPFLPSGTVLLSDINRGLFILRLQRLPRR